MRDTGEGSVTGRAVRRSGRLERLVATLVSVGILLLADELIDDIVNMNGAPLAATRFILTLTTLMPGSWLVASSLQRAVDTLIQAKELRLQGAPGQQLTHRSLVNKTVKIIVFG